MGTFWKWSQPDVLTWEGVGDRKGKRRVSAEILDGAGIAHSVAGPAVGL